MKKILLIIAMNFIFMESDLLRSKYLTEDMINDIEKLDNYNKSARKIFNKYEKAQFYQMVAYTYYLKYERLVQELESLDRHYYSLFNTYIENIDYSFIEEQVKTPGVQNEFIPILFEEDSSINIRLFKAQAKMFQKQYHDYLDYFNRKINLYNNKLIELKQSNLPDKKQTKNYNKIYNDYNDFLLEIEAIDEPLLMMNGDLLTRLDFGQLLDYHAAHGGAATMCVREYDFQIPYGVVKSDELQVKDIVEKPIQKFFVNAGIYVLEPELIAQCKSEQSKDMPDLLRDAIRAGDKVNMFPIHEYWMDIGRMDEYDRAQKDVSGIFE